MASYVLDLLYFGQTHPERLTSVPLNKRVPYLEMSNPSLPKGFMWSQPLSYSDMTFTKIQIQIIPDLGLALCLYYVLFLIIICLCLLHITTVSEIYLTEIVQSANKSTLWDQPVCPQIGPNSLNTAAWLVAPHFKR